MDSNLPVFDVCVVGGGVNGCGIARDAAGRGLKVLLCEKQDLAGATSSASTKLFHGGLRYLEHYKFRLVREALLEREVLLRAMPHISWPLRFVLPHHEGLRPAWLLRLGLFIYDNLGGRKILPATRSVDLTRDSTGKPLKKVYAKGFEYSDCWVEDSRLVVLNARDAKMHGATILTRTSCSSATPSEGIWQINLTDEVSGTTREIRAKTLVNAAGPWVEDMIRQKLRQNSSKKVRLVRGSHIVVRRLYEHDRAYIFQNGDGRIVFAIPYETDFTLIGTTDVDRDGDPRDASCTPEEARYLCEAVSAYFERNVTPEDIFWTYSGVRPLYDDGSGAASQATRDYVLDYDASTGAPMLNVFGGKITTYRKLAEEVLDQLRHVLGELTGKWTAGAPLPGGDFQVDGYDALVADLLANFPDLGERTAKRLVRAYGTEAADVCTHLGPDQGFGIDFGNGLHEAEVQWLVRHEWARTSEDILWRRSKLGLRFSEDQTAKLRSYLAETLDGGSIYSA